MTTLHDLINITKEKNIKTKDINIWICKKRKDNNKALEKTFGTSIFNIELDKDNDIRIILK